MKWGEAHTQSADQVKTGEQEQGAENSTKLGVAVHIYETELANGKRLHREVHSVLDAAGISDATKRRARQKLGVASTRSAPWYWWLPGKEHEEDSPERKIQDQEAL